VLNHPNQTTTLTDVKITDRFKWFSEYRNTPKIIVEAGELVLDNLKIIKRSNTTDDVPVFIYLHKGASVVIKKVEFDVDNVISVDSPDQVSKFQIFNK